MSESVRLIRSTARRQTLASLSLPMLGSKSNQPLWGMELSLNLSKPPVLPAQWERRIDRD